MSFRPSMYRGGSRLVAGGCQSVVVICHSSYEPGEGATHVILLTQGLILAGC